MFTLGRNESQQVKWNAANMKRTHIEMKPKKLFNLGNLQLKE